jgi:hypothetical protein
VAPRRWEGELTSAKLVNRKFQLDFCILTFQYQLSAIIRQQGPDIVLLSWGIPQHFATAINSCGKNSNFVFS